MRRENIFPHLSHFTPILFCKFMAHNFQGDKAIDSIVKSKTKKLANYLSHLVPNKAIKSI